MQQTTTNPSPQEGNEERRQRQAEQSKALIDLLESWTTEGDAEEQRETWDIIRKGLDEHPFQIRRDDQ